MKKRTITSIILVVLFFIIAVNLFHTEKDHNLKLEKLRRDYISKPIPSVDHSKLPELQIDFNTPQEVTETCITCHTERHKEVINSSHWNWGRYSYIEGRGITETGKKNVLNNFCIGASANEIACAKCHIGFGMENSDEFDFNNARNVDCMVCHDNSEEYLKGSSLAGYPDRNVNLQNVARSVGQPKKENCGSCHFYSGGGNNVKHGDLEEALLSTDKTVDVHMAKNGMDMSCTDCHTAENHQIKGKLYSVSSDNNNRAFCEDCHTTMPHLNEMLNLHGSTIACQTCHIPYYSKVNATKMSWDWSEAGKLKDGEPYHEEDEDGNHTYLSIKGSFEWAKNVQPDYIWFNGTADHYILGDTITSIPVQMNTMYGAYGKTDSKIIPVKIHTGKQIYDKKYNTLIQPKLWAPEKGDSAYWKDFDWNTAAAAGMKTVGLPYSGEFGFVETEMYWPINHMVSTKEEAVQCSECHTRDDGRLAELTGFYMPGRDRSFHIDLMGGMFLIISLLAVVVHGGLRILSVVKQGTKIIEFSKKEE